MTFKRDMCTFSCLMANPWSGYCPMGSVAVGCADVMVVVSKKR